MLFLYTNLPPLMGDTPDRSFEDSIEVIDSPKRIRKSLLLLNVFSKVLSRSYPE